MDKPWASAGDDADWEADEWDVASTMGQPTPSELEVLRLVAEGYTDKRIASRLHRSPRTVQFHLRNAGKKLSARSRTQIVYRARVTGWIN